MEPSHGSDAGSTPAARSKSPAKRTRRTYTPTEVKAALTTLAFFGGNAARASQQTGIPEMTLRDWRNTEHRDQYLEIAEAERPRLEQIATTQALELMMRSAEAEHDLLSSLATVASDPEQSKTASELAGALQKVTTSKGINTDKFFTHTGRPSQYVEHRDGTQILKSLGAKIPGLVIESTADEIRALPSPIVESNARDAVSLRPGD